jgi:phage terminase large subunit GpA-like protein
MSIPINYGGPAFPHFKTDSATGYVELCPQGGMTLRDYFAGQALAGMMAHDQTSSWQDYEVAGDCYVYADAMIKARGVSK